MHIRQTSGVPLANESPYMVKYSKDFRGYKDKISPPEALIFLFEIFPEVRG
jgi:hypothetical protein